MKHVPSFCCFVGSVMFLFCLFPSCENDIKEVNSYARIENLPSMRVDNLLLIESDSGLTSYRLMAPVAEKYTETEEPYLIFPKGVHIIGYDRFQNVSSEITANHAKHFDNDDKWIATNDVVAINHQDGNMLNSEYLVWDVTAKKIYSDKFTKITTADGVFYGKNGFEADENFTKWRLINTNGEINVKDE